MGEKVRRFVGGISFEDGLCARVEGQVRDALPCEACGVFLARRDGETLVVYADIPAKNLAKGEGRFLLDPAAWIEAEEGGAEILIPWHSHPGGCERPSPGDEALLERYPLIAIACLHGDHLGVHLWGRKPGWNPVG